MNTKLRPPRHHCFYELARKDAFCLGIIYFKETRQLKGDLVGYGCHILTFHFTILCTCIFTGSKIGVITFWGFLADDMCKKLSCRYLGGGSTFYTFAKISFLLRSVFRAKTPWTVKWDQLQVVSLRFICLKEELLCRIRNQALGWLGTIVGTIIYIQSELTAIMDCCCPSLRLFQLG